MRSIEELKQVNSEVKDVSPRLLRTDGGTQYRDGINDETMKSYLQAIKEGAVFPPIQTVFDGQCHWVVDGFHRLAALIRLGTLSIEVSCIEGSQEEAQLLALTANATHGLPRDHYTKRKIGLAALAHPAFAGSSSYEIAKACGLSQPFIRGLRDPEVKVRQQEARDRSVLKRIKPEVTNPIRIVEPENAIDAAVDHEFDQCGAIPSDEEIRAAELAMQADQDMLYKLLESDDALATAHEEIKRLNYLYAQIEVRFNGLMAEKAEAVKQIKTEQARCKRLQAKLRGYERTRPEIALGAEVHARQSMVEALRPQ